MFRFIKEWDKLAMWKQLGFPLDEATETNAVAPLSAVLPSLMNTSLETIRHYLHAEAELSGQEKLTAASIVGWLQEAGATRIVTGLGGHGVAGVFSGGEKGPKVMLRAELDALPISERGDAREWRSRNEHIAHSIIQKEYVTVQHALRFIEHVCRRNMLSGVVAVVTMDT